MKNRCYIILEAGVNHNGSVETAKQLIEAANSIGADCIKFQIFQAKNLVTKTLGKAEYQSKNLQNEESSQFSMLKKLELSKEEFLSLKEYSDSLGIDFLVTPFDEESLDFTVNQLNSKVVKVSSGDLNNYPFLYEIAKTSRDIIISSGMATYEEIEKALKYIALAYKYPEADTPKSYEEELLDDLWPYIENRVTLFHCTSEYPAPLDEVNLNVIDTFKEKYRVKIGYSDHTEGIRVPVLAAAKNIHAIEKHFTLDNQMEGPDHKASIDVQAAKCMVDEIREAEKIMGCAEKSPTESEEKNKNLVRKVLVAKKDIDQGEVFSKKNIGFKRAGEGMAPEKAWSLYGLPSSIKYSEDEVIHE